MTRDFIPINDNNNFVKILFEVEKIENMKDDENTLSNADITDISFFRRESEVLIFPFSCFIVKVIEKDKDNNNDIIKITLEYLGRYREEINNKLKNIEEFNINIKFTESLI